MGKFDVDIPFITNKEHQYLIRFSENDQAYLPEEFAMTVVGIVIETNELPATSNDFSTLFHIARVIRDYLNHHDVILYAICSSAEINKGKKRGNLSNQQYRSELFNRIFEKLNTDGLDLKNLEIMDEKGEIEYFHLISHEKNNKYMDELYDYHSDK